MDPIGFEKYRDKYPDIPFSRMQSLWQTLCIRPESFVDAFKTVLEDINETQESEKTFGKQHLQAGPLINVMSARVVPKTSDDPDPDPDVVYEDWSVFGDIYAEVDGDDTYSLYHHSRDSPEAVAPYGTLALDGPSHWCIPMYKTVIIVDIWDEISGLQLVNDRFNVDDITFGDFDEYRFTYVQGMHGSVLFTYAAIPCGVLARVELTFNPRIYREEDDDSSLSTACIDVNGTVGIRYNNAYGTYGSAECSLFKKLSNEFERVKINGESLRLHRSWVAVPAYSSLVVDLNLCNYRTGKKIIQSSVQLLAQDNWMSGDAFAVEDDLSIRVRAAWFSPYLKGIYDEEEPELVSGEEPSTPSTPGIPRAPSFDRSKPLGGPLLEVFSVFVGRRCHSLHLYGFISISFGDNTYDLFRREKKEAVLLLDHEPVVPITDSCMLSFDTPLVIRADLKDRKSSFVIRGYANWDIASLESRRTDWSWYNKPLCSVIQGDSGYATIHYTVFSHGVRATMTVFYEPQKGSIHGHIVAKHNNCDYSTHYRRQYYQSVLFKKMREDALKIGRDGEIELSRSMVVVSSSWPLILDIDLHGDSGERVKDTTKINVGVQFVGVDGRGCSIRILIKWS